MEKCGDKGNEEIINQGTFPVLLWDDFQIT